MLLHDSVVSAPGNSLAYDALDEVIQAVTFRLVVVYLILRRIYFRSH